MTDEEWDIEEERSREKNRESIRGGRDFVLVLFLAFIIWRLAAKSLGWP